jgi:hypothetical protein
VVTKVSLFLSIFIFIMTIMRLYYTVVPCSTLYFTHYIMSANFGSQLPIPDRINVI